MALRCSLSIICCLSCLVPPSLTVCPVEVTLLSPIAMDQGLKFAIREGGKTVGAGVVAEILE